MASHVIGPLLVADRPLTEDELALLDAEAIWTLGLLEPPPPPPPPVVVFRARPKRSHGNQRGATVSIPRPRETTAMLPRRQGYQPIPHGNSGVMGDEPTAYYGESWYGESGYGA